MRLKLTRRLPEGHRISRDLDYLRSKTGHAKIWIVKSKGGKSLIHKSFGDHVSSYTTEKINENLDQIPELVNKGQRGDFVLLSDENVVYRDSALMFWDGSQVILPEYDFNIRDYGLVPKQFYDICRNFNYWGYSTMVETTAANLQYFFMQNGMSELELRYKNNSLSFYGVKDNEGKIALLGRSKAELENALQEKKLILPFDFPFNGDGFSDVYKLLGVIVDENDYVDKIEERKHMVRVYLDGERVSEKSRIFKGMLGGQVGVYFPDSYLAWDLFDVDEIPKKWREKLQEKYRDSSDSSYSTD